MCLNQLTTNIREIDVAYGILDVEKGGRITRLYRTDKPSKVNNEGWEIADDILLKTNDGDSYRGGFHLFENFYEAIIALSLLPMTRGIIVAFEVKDIRTQGIEYICNAYRGVNMRANISVVGKRRPLYIAWDKKYGGRR